MRRQSSCTHMHCMRSMMEMHGLGPRGQDRVVVVQASAPALEGSVAARMEGMAVRNMAATVGNSVFTTSLCCVTCHQCTINALVVQHQELGTCSAAPRAVSAARTIVC